jgi:hypothetical protein
MSGGALGRMVASQKTLGIPTPTMADNAHDFCTVDSTRTSNSFFKLPAQRLASEKTKKTKTNQETNQNKQQSE